MVKIIGDPGSCHMGKLRLAEELVRLGRHCGLDAVKFQLFKESPGNIPLPYKWFPSLVSMGRDIGIEVFASVWDLEGMDMLKECSCHSIKFAMSQNKDPKIKTALINFPHVYISGDVHSDFPDNAIKLFCIPQYPVMLKPSFFGLFPKRFKGYSDHTIDRITPVHAVYHGAQVIEKHFRLNNVECDKVPDGRFALKPDTLKKMVESIRHIEFEPQTIQAEV